MTKGNGLVRSESSLGIDLGSSLQEAFELMGACAWQSVTVGLQDGLVMVTVMGGGRNVQVVLRHAKCEDGKERSAWIVPNEALSLLRDRQNLIDDVWITFAPNAAQLYLKDDIGEVYGPFVLDRLQQADPEAGRLAAISGLEVTGCAGLLDSGYRFEGQLGEPKHPAQVYGSLHQGQDPILLQMVLDDQDTMDDARHLTLPAPRQFNTWLGIIQGKVMCEQNGGQHEC